LLGFPGRPGGEDPLREVVGGSEAAVVVHQQFADAGAGLDERAEGVVGLGESEGSTRAPPPPRIPGHSVLLPSKVVISAGLLDRTLLPG
jgi:hypothetical protein